MFEIRKSCAEQIGSHGNSAWMRTTNTYQQEQLAVTHEKRSDLYRSRRCIYLKDNERLCDFVFLFLNRLLSSLIAQLLIELIKSMTE